MRLIKLAPTPRSRKGARRSFFCHLIFLALALASGVHGESLQQEFVRLMHGFDGRVGVCAIEGSQAACVNGDQRFAMQSVMKLLAGLAVLDRVDNRGWSLDESVTVRRDNLSLYVQPIANIVKAKGSFRTTIGDLVRRAVVDSDSAATDILVDRLGGPPAVQAFLDRKGIRGVRFDRDEKRLQTEIVGLTWKPDFVDAAVLDEAIKAVPAEVRDAANRRYEKDVRDTATPMGMASMLDSLGSGRLLSNASTRWILDVMSHTAAFPDRLKAGVPPGWTIAHKTGTSGTWKGMTIATNDVGIVTAPDGTRVAIAVFIADSRASDSNRAALMAALAKSTVAHHSPKAPLR